MRTGLTVMALLVWLVSPGDLLAQTARDARVALTVLDQTNSVIPGATVTLVRLDGPSGAAAIPPVQTSDQGVALVPGLPPGRYDVRAEFSGFDVGVLKDVRLRAGENRHVIVLKIQRLQDAVTVGQDPDRSASDRRGPSFGSALTREQIDALSDDPEEMRRQLQDMAGGIATLRVDSFEGSELPPKAMIKSIRVTRDAFAAENHNPGAIFIDIITQPGLGSLRGGIQTRFRSGAMSGRSPFTPTKGPEQIQDYNINLGGPLRTQRSSFSINLNGASTYDTPNLNVTLPNQSVARALTQRTHRDRAGVNALFDYALTTDQTLRMAFFANRQTSGNLGIGAYDLPERAYDSRDTSYNLRIQEAGPLGRRFFTNTRVALLWNQSRSTPALEAPTIRVLDAFTSGGAQTAGGRRSRAVNVFSDLDYVRGIHSVRSGVSLETGWHRSTVTSNYLGTYTFGSREAFEAGDALSYTRRIGDPTIDYFYGQGGFYLQDDIRVRRNLTITPGVRYEAQTHISDFGNIGPRFGITWSPGKSGKTTLRASAGVFYDWLNTNTYEQSLRIDGFRQQELNILDPAYPEVSGTGDVPPVNRYFLDDDLRMAKNTRVSAGIDQVLVSRWRAGVLYAHIRGTGLLRGVNLNAPIEGVRPDPTFSNVIGVVSDARMRQHTVTISTSSGGPLAPPFGGAAGRRWDFKRTSINANYTLGFLENNTDGDFATPPTGSLDAEWGPAANDVRHRLFVGVTTQALRNFNVSLNVNASSASRYTVRTGGDDNADGIFNDRPAGIGRNTELGASQWSLNGTFAYAIAFGKGRSTPNPGGIMVQSAPGQAPVVTTFAVPQARFRVQFIVQAQNLTNHANYGGYSGTRTSLHFGTPTLVMNPRKVDFGIGFLF